MKNVFDLSPINMNIVSTGAVASATALSFFCETGDYSLVSPGCKDKSHFATILPHSYREKETGIC